MLGSGRLPLRTIPFRRQVIARRCIPLRFSASLSGREDTCTMHFWVISQFPRLRIGIYLDYSIVHGPESVPPAYAARESRLLAPDHSGGSANDVSHGPPSSCPA